MDCIRTGILALSMFASTAANAASPQWAEDQPVARIVTISADHGGRIVNYAIKISRIRREAGYVRFDGRCDSACTLYLGLSAAHTCVTPQAAFGFHLPFGVSQHAAATAARYMLGQYPGWVREWIAARGGLTHGLKTMPYSYARRHMPACGNPQMASNDG